MVYDDEDLSYVAACAFQDSIQVSKEKSSNLLDPQYLEVGIPPEVATVGTSA